MIMDAAHNLGLLQYKLQTHIRSKQEPEAAQSIHMWIWEII